MMHFVHVKLNPGLPWQSIVKPDAFRPKFGPKFKKATSKFLHLEHSNISC